MKKWFISLVVTVPLLLVGCNADSNDEDTIDKKTDSVDPASLEVVVDILTPEKLAVNEKVELEAKVTQNNEAVDDAEVKFEVWESGFRDQGQMIEGKLEKDGIYKAEYTFDHDGVYYMYAHTNARGMHVMPKQKFIVGNPDMSKVVEDHSDDSMENHNSMDQNNSSHDHNSSSEKEDNNSSMEHNSNSHNH